MIESVLHRKGLLFSLLSNLFIKYNKYEFASKIGYLCIIKLH